MSNRNQKVIQLLLERKLLKKTASRLRYFGN